MNGWWRSRQKYYFHSETTTWAKGAGVKPPLGAKEYFAGHPYRGTGAELCEITLRKVWSVCHFALTTLCWAHSSVFDFKVELHRLGFDAGDPGDVLSRHVQDLGNRNCFHLLCLHGCVGLVAVGPD